MGNYFSRSYNALTTGYDHSGMKNYAYSSSVPGFSLTGSQPFTILTTLNFRSVQHGMIFRQEGVFEMGLENGLLFISAPSICTVKFPKEVMRFVPNLWYMLTITFDGSQLRVYVDGFEAAMPPCTVAPVATSVAYYEMGTELEAYIRQVLLYPVALGAKEVHHSFMNPEARTAECAAWFDFSGERITERSGKGVPVSVKGFAKIVNTCRVLSTGGGIAMYTPFDVVHPGKDGYTWTAKIYPQRTTNETMCVATNSDAERASGWMLWLQKESDDAFRVCLRIGGSSGPVLTSDRTVNTFGWTDVAWTYNETTIILYLDGEATGTATNIATESLQGDGRTTFCGVTRRGKIDNKYAYSGHVAYVAEFAKCLTTEVLLRHMTVHPFVLDEYITGMFDFTDNILTERCTLQAFTVNGQAGIAWAENTNRLTDPQTAACYLPAVDNSYWNSLSDELKWEVELYGSIFNSYLRDVLGYELKAEDEKWYCSAAAYIVTTGLATPEFSQILSEGTQVEQSSVAAFEVATIEKGQFSVLGSITATASAGSLMTVTGVSSSAESIILGIATAVAGVVMIATLTIITVIIVKKCMERPNNTVIQILSIEFNHNSNSLTGGIHIRRDNNVPIQPPEWQPNVNNEANRACCAYIINQDGFAPSVMVRIMLVTEDPAGGGIAHLEAIENGGHILGNCELGNINLQPNVAIDINIPLLHHQINNDALIALPPINGMWEWRCTLNGGNHFVANTHHRVYRLLGIPVNPWIFQAGVGYNVNTLSYPWTTSMEVAATMCERGIADGDNELMGCLARGLNASPNFRYQSGSQYTNFFFNISLFQQHFYLDEAVWGINCRDCAFIVATYGNLHGQNLSIIMLSSALNDGEGGFFCNPIISIGYNVWAEPFDGRGFRFHDIVASHNEGRVTDACLKIDAGLNPSQLGGGKNATIAGNMQLTNQDINDPVNMIEPFEPQVYRERLVRNGQDCRIFKETFNWFFGNIVVIPASLKMLEYYKLIERDYGIKTDVTSSSETPLICASALRLDAIPDLIVDDREVHSGGIAEHFIYREKWIQIYIQVCESVESARVSLIYRLGDINYRHIPTAEERGIELGEKAFIIQDEEGLNTCILLYRQNVVVYLSCATTEHVDLLPLARALDRQMQEV